MAADNNKHAAQSHTATCSFEGAPFPQRVSWSTERDALRLMRNDKRLVKVTYVQLQLVPLLLPQGSGPGGTAKTAGECSFRPGAPSVGRAPFNEDVAVFRQPDLSAERVAIACCTRV